ncbi:MAG TPA: class I SAM-dependent methyltransferase [Saprospiraceae bacterium]|nr:class I SAM-dependent methyltransferase [Saprospiraceae bacterium]
MFNLKSYIDYICQPNPYRREAAPDICHNFLLFGTILSQKPDKVLELGVGTSFTSHSILYALKYNQKGELTCVDNMGDWNGIEGNDTPNIINNIKSMGADSVLSCEENYVKGCQENTYDLIVSDADHNCAHLWKEELFRITKPNGILFFHDVTNKGFKLHEYVDYVKEKNIYIDPNTLTDKQKKDQKFM